MNFIRFIPASFIRKQLTWYRSTRRRNKVLVIIGLIIMLLIAMNLLGNANARPDYTTAVARKDDIVQIVSETGNINTSGRTDVYSNTTGIIEEIYVGNGMGVETGQALFSVRSTATEAEKAQAYATYQNAVSTQTTATQGGPGNDALMWTKQQTLLDAKNAKNYKDTHTKNPATNADYTELEKQSIDAAVVQAEKDFRAAEQKYKETGISINAASAQVSSTWLAYLATQSSVVYAPTFGTIANLSLSVGDNVAAGSGGSASLTSLGAQTSSTLGSSVSPVLTIANLVNNFSLKVAINEVDIPKVKSGQDAVITIDAFSDKKFDGRVTQVDSVGTNNAGVVTYNVSISILNPVPQIKPGMTAGVDIEVDKAEDVLSVPNSAVKPYKGGRAVRVFDKKTKQITYIPVTIGIKGEDKTQIIKGITEGQEIISSLPNDQVKRPGLFGN
jgi:multidrug efflux pump subunit AcrA (membrane-fusion protein)